MLKAKFSLCETNKNIDLAITVNKTLFQRDATYLKLVQTQAGISGRY